MCMLWVGAVGVGVVWDWGIRSATEVIKVNYRQKGDLNQIIH